MAQWGRRVNIFFWIMVPIGLIGLSNLNGLTNLYSPNSSKNLLILMIDPILGTKMTITGPFLWNGSSKIKILTDIWYSFCWRLLRPANGNFENWLMKLKWANLLNPLGTMIQENIDPSTPQSHLESYVSIWDTMYVDIAKMNPALSTFNRCLSAN